MKNSGIEWIGEIPDDWKVVFLSSILKEHKRKNSGLICNNLLSLSYGKIKRKDINTTDGLLPQNFEGYNIIDDGDIVLRLTDLQNDQRSLRTGIAHETGIVTSAYVTVRCLNTIAYPNYMHYLLHSFDTSKGFYGMGDGVRQGLSYDGIKNIELLLPPIIVQQKIADYLDKKCAAVDRLIENQRAQIEKLKEYKQSVITEAVTKGLDPSVPLKDSGLKFGMIPCHWCTIQFKNVAKLANGREVVSTEGNIPVYGSGGIFKYTDNYLYDGVSLLMGRKGTIDNPMLVSGKFWTVDTMFYTSEIKNILPKFLYYLVCGIVDYGYYKSGSVLPSMTQTEINNIRLTYPPFEEQKQIAEYLDKKCGEIDRLIAIKQKKIETLAEYKKSLIYEYVTGKKQVA